MTAFITMTQDLAQQVAREKTTQRMVKQGRKKWNNDDWNYACAYFDKLFPLPEAIRRGLGYDKLEKIETRGKTRGRRA